MVSLNEINQEVDSKFGPFVIEDVEGGDVVLRNILRLTRNERAQLGELQAAVKAAKGDANKVIDATGDLLRLIAVGDGGDRLISALADDPSKVMHVFKLYQEATQAGEAQDSES